MALRAVHAFGRVFDVEVVRTGANLEVRVLPVTGGLIARTTPAGGTIAIAF